MEHIPVFVKITSLQDIGGLINLLKQQINEAEATLEKIKSSSEEEASKIEKWKENFNSITEKLDGLNNYLLEPGKI